MTKPKPKAGATECPIRLVFRTEGQFVNAYLALADTMDKSVLLGSIRLTAAEPAVLAVWKALMSEIVMSTIEAVSGERPFDVIERSAPAHEAPGPAEPAPTHNPSRKVH